MIAMLAVASAVYSIDKPYSYRIPDGMHVLPGMRVIVPFGRGNRRSEAFVLKIEDDAVSGLKSIDRVLDTAPMMTDQFIRMAAFIRERYFCTFYDAIKAMLPAGLWFNTTATYTRTEKDASRARLSDLERLVLAVFEESGVQLTCDQIKSLIDSDEDLEAALQNLVRKKYLSCNLDFSRKIHDKTEQIVTLAVPAEEAMEYAHQKQRSAPVQYEFLKLLSTVGSGSSKELCYLTGATGQTVRRLEELGFLSCHTREVYRSALPTHIEPAEVLQLSAQQQAAFEGLLAQSELDKPGVSLLYGVTGSGKTSVYIQLIKSVLKKGRGALLLVPEIALTPQLISLLMSYFGNDVAVLHSALRVSERYDTWKKITQGDVHVVIGTRSAVFAPLQDLGLIIVDEEQEHTYKSENTPRYHAREVAIYRGAKEHALVVLGSATPSIETMYLAKKGTYTLFSLTERYNGKSLPSVALIDMKQEIKRGNGTDISQALRSAIEDNLINGKQSILFLNRRGAGRSVICVDCGDVVQCPRCSVSLTYHRRNHRQMCHHCGFSLPAADRCEKCGGHLKVIGTGTQKIEQELQQMFPNVATVRMDADTITACNTHEDILNRFEGEKIPVLIGTQMVTKGLNFENVTLVGVVDADMSLYVDHYRAAETTFSMLTQVVGRSGRGAYAGKALIQTMTPEHSVLQLASKQDYDSFYDLEITMRQLQQCPPFGDIFTVTFVGLYEESTVRAAYGFRSLLETYRLSPSVKILGPSPAYVVKVNNRYRYNLTVCCSNDKNIRLQIAAALKAFGKNKKYKDVSAWADINPYE